MQNNIVTIPDAFTPTPLVSWTTKSGTTKSAHSATGAALAPKAARLTAAMESDLAMLRNGQFRPFLRDLADAMTPAIHAGLEAHMRAHWAHAINVSNDVAVLRSAGVALAGGDILPANKAGLLALAGFMASPTKATGPAKARVYVPAEFKGKLAALSAVLAVYVAPTADATADATV